MRWQTAHTREALCDAMARKLAVIPGIDTQFSQYIEDNVDEAVSGIKSELAVKVFGPDTYKLQKLEPKSATQEIAARHKPCTQEWRLRSATRSLIKAVIRFSKAYGTRSSGGLNRAVRINL